MFKKITIILYQIIRIFVVCVLTALGSTITLFTAYIIDPNFTSNFTGNDVMSAYNYAVWMNKIFPSFYFWYPAQGAGVSFISGYQWFAHLLVILLQRATQIPLSAAFATIRSLSFPITGIGIILFATTRLDYPKQILIRVIIGTIASIFFLLSPITWYWTHKWGFYAEGVSYMFIPYALLFADWFIELSFKEDRSIKKKCALIFAAIFWSLGLMTHFYTGTGIAHFIILLISGRFLTAIISLKKTETTFIQRVKHNSMLAFQTGLLLAVTFLIFSGWRLFSYLDYTHEVAKGGFAGDIFSSQNAKALNKPSLGQLTQLEFIAFPDPRFIFDGYSVPLTIWIGAAITLLLGWIRSRKVFFMSLAVLYGFFCYSSSDLIAFTYKLGPLAQILNFRSVWTVYRSILPIVAAYGFFIIPDLLYAPIQLLLQKINKILGIISSYSAQPIIIAVGGIALLAYTATNVELHKSFLSFKFPQYLSTINYFPTPDIWLLTAGRHQIDSRDIWSWQDSHYELLTGTDAISSRIKVNEIKKLCESSSSDSLLSEVCPPLKAGALLSPEQKKNLLNVCEKTDRDKISQRPYCQFIGKSLAWQLLPQNWPRITFPDSAAVTSSEKAQFDFLPNNSLQTRYDLSGLSGSMLMRSSLLTPLSTTQVYINQLSLFSALWNYQSSVMYSEQPRYQKPGVLTQLANYFGYEYVNAVTNSQLASDLYSHDTNWEKLPQGSWWRFTKPTGLATWTNKPSLLVISNNEKFGYDQFFKVSNLGVLSYDDGIIFGGKSYVDDYTFEELQQFSTLFLTGYQYHKPDKGYALLEQYVKLGGHLFIDTGWQFQSPDWQIENNVPAFFPTNKISWKSFDGSAQIQTDQTDILNYQPQSNTIGTLSLTGKSWGASVANDVRSDSTVLLQSKGSPLMIARKYGKGKVIWSGLNSIAHIESGLEKDNSSEITLLKNALHWLIQSDCKDETCKPDKLLKLQIKRLNPDHITFTALEDTTETTTLYWRESYYPKWNATLRNKAGKSLPLTVYRAGPRLIGMRLPAVTASDTVQLEIKNSLKDNIIIFVTITGIAILTLYIFNLLPRILNKFHLHTKSERNDPESKQNIDEEDNTISP